MRIHLNNFGSLPMLTISSLFVMLIGIKDNLYAQQSFLPFDSTWYGFNTQVEVGTQSYFISSSRLVDIDNDGDSDVVASKFGSDLGTSRGFFVLRNNGDGVFNNTAVHYDSPLASRYLEVSDLNNDGLKDVVLSNTGSNDQGSSVLVYFNQGNGIFGNPTSYPVGAGPVGIAAADFNEDGNIDLAVTNYRGGLGTSVSILMNSGGGLFSPAVNYPAGDAPYAVVAAKIDSGASVDLVIAGGWVNGGATVNILLNSGNGTFPNRTEFAANGRAYIPSVAIDDVDNDGDNDILFPFFDFNNGAIINLYRNQGSGTFLPEAIQMDANTVIADIKTADLNGDGWNDIIASSASARTTDGYEVALNNGNGGFNFTYRHPAGQNTAVVMPGDVDNDGWTDILTADSYSMQITVHKNFGEGLFPQPHLIDLAGSEIVGSVDAADIDGDGLPDVVISASGRAAVDVPVKVLKNLGNGIFEAPVVYSARGGGIQAKFRDLNGDNIPDLVFATGIGSPPYDFHYTINNGDGTFGPVQTKSMPSDSKSCGWYDIDAFDLNNDGKKDVVLTEWLGCPDIPLSARRIYICLNNGNDTFADPIVKIVGPHPAPLGGGDFNNDGNIDIVSGISGGVIELYLGIGNGDISAPLQYPIGGIGAEDLVVADFNGDGNLDIASDNLVDFGTYSMSVLYGNGDGTFQPALILPSPQTPDLLNISGITTGDINNDGTKDIMVANYASHTISLYLNNNNTFSYSPMRVGLYWGVYSPFFADFDNDGNGDLVMAGELPPYGLFSTLIFLKGRTANPTSVSRIEDIAPKSFALGQNFPNPFNPSTRIKYSVAQSSKVVIKIFDILGNEIETLLNEDKQAGNYELTFNAAELPSGVYFYRLQAGSFTETKKMIVLK